MNLKQLIKEVERLSNSLKQYYVKVIIDNERLKMGDVVALRGAGDDDIWKNQLKGIKQTVEAIQHKVYFEYGLPELEFKDWQKLKKLLGVK